VTDGDSIGDRRQGDRRRYVPQKSAKRGLTARKARVNGGSNADSRRAAGDSIGDGDR